MTQLSLQHLEAFVLTSEEGSFSAAAIRLGKAQSVVSTLVQNLELDLGIDLFDRSKKKPVLTEPGKALLDYAEQTLTAAYRLKQAANACAKEVESELCISIEDYIEPDNLSVILERFQSHFPNTSIELISTSSDKLIEMLYVGKVQIGFMLSRNDYPRWLNFHVMGNQPLPVLVHPDHPLATMENVSIQDVRKYRQLVFITRSKLKNMKISDSAWYCEHISSALNLAAQGLGWTNAPKRLYQPYVDAGQLEALQLYNDDVDWSLVWDIVWNTESEIGPAARWLLQEFGPSLSPT